MQITFPKGDSVVVKLLFDSTLRLTNQQDIICLFVPPPLPLHSDTLWNGDFYFKIIFVGFGTPKFLSNEGSASRIWYWWHKKSYTTRTTTTKTSIMKKVTTKKTTIKTTVM